MTLFTDNFHVTAGALIPSLEHWAMCTLMASDKKNSNGCQLLAIRELRLLLFCLRFVIRALHSAIVLCE